MKHVYVGGCHCENLHVRLASALSPAELGTRTDTCSFCACMDDRGVLYINVLAERQAFLANAIQIADLDGETTDDRLARRRRRWTPLRVV